MLTWIAIGAGVVIALALATLVPHGIRRRRLYRDMAECRRDIVAAHRPQIAAPLPTAALREEFERERVIRVDSFLAPETLAHLEQEYRENLSLAERSFLPGHKKGGTISYERIHDQLPHSLGVYHSQELRQWLSELIGEDVRPTADHDQSSCSILCYNEAGDHINWHYDHNFYRGRHFTVLIPVVNRAAAGGVSASQFLAKKDGRAVEFSTAENSLVVFEGARVLHKASKARAGDLRLVLSMTFGTDPHISVPKEVVRRFKDTAYYGIRALWD